MADSVSAHPVLLGHLPLAVACELVRLTAAAPDLRLVGPAGGTTDLLAHAQELRPTVIVAASSQLPALAQLARPAAVLVYAGPAAAPLSGVNCGEPLNTTIQPLPHLLAERAAWRQDVLQKLRLAALPRRWGRLAGALPPSGLVVIGASTGGPAAVEVLLAQLRPGLPCAVLVAVHLPAFFTASLVARLRRVSALPVAAASPGRRLEAGQVLVVPGGTNMVVRRSAAGTWTTCLAPEPAPTGSDVPCVDLLMSSAAAAVGPAVLGVVLTGLGHDGTRGARAIREHGGQVLVQDGASAAVFSMPGAVLRAGWASAALPLAGLAAAINELGRAVPAAVPAGPPEAARPARHPRPIPYPLPTP